MRTVTEGLRPDRRTFCRSRRAGDEVPERSVVRPTARIPVDRGGKIVASLLRRRPLWEDLV